MDDKLILLKRINPTEYEIHRYVIDQRRNLILTTTDLEFAEKLVNGYNRKLSAVEYRLQVVNDEIENNSHEYNQFNLAVLKYERIELIKKLKLFSNV